MKKDATAFAIMGASMIAVLFGIVNYITTPGILWFFYPVFAAAWWPLAVYFCEQKRYLAFSVAGALWTIAFLVTTNLVTSPQTLWFLYTLLPVLCWPLGVYFRRKMRLLPVAVLSSVAFIAYYVAVNLLLTPQYFWAIYPAYLTLWWPMGLYFIGRREFKKFSIVGALCTIAFFIASNLLDSSYPWALYACFPVLWWPLSVYTGRRPGRALRFSILGSVCTVAWYGALNLLLAPQSPWIVFIAYAVLWWPLSVYFYGRGPAHRYAAVMSAISIVFFAAVNLLYSPGAPWAFYPAFVLLWWPVTLFFARKRAWFGYSIAGSLLTISFLVTINLVTSPGYLWSVYPSPCLLWWPLSVYFARRKNPFGFAVGGSIWVTGYFTMVNLMTSPGFLWCVFPVFAVLWWPLSIFFSPAYRRRLAK